MTPHNRDDALSEVIGFILILAVIALAASFYVTYVVPAQGREGEIKHMNYIKDQFVDFKTSVDSLWVNNQKGVSLSRVINPGTLGWTTQGSFVNMPLFTPIGSGGTLSVGESGGTMISYNIANGIFSTQSAVPIPRYISANLIGTILDQKEEIVSILPNPVNSNFNISLIASNTTNQTNLYITVNQSGIITVDRLLLASAITPSTAPIKVNLLDSRYSLKNVLVYPYNLNITNSDNLETHDENWNSDEQLIRMTGFSNNNYVNSYPTGVFRYQSQNNYWIQQQYLYESGAVILSQNDGSISKLVPSITVLNQSANALVKLTYIRITSPNTTIGGTTPIQIVTTIDDITKNAINSTHYLIPDIPNAVALTITVYAQTENEAEAWNSSFEEIRRDANVPKEWISAPTHESNSKISSMTINGPLASPDARDIILDFTIVNLTVNLQPTAGGLG
jgi:hypothetical protein